MKGHLTKKFGTLSIPSDYKEVMYAFYMSPEKPAGSHKNTFKTWRSRNNNVKMNLDGNKSANVWRVIMNKKRLTDFELTEIKDELVDELVAFNTPQ